MNNTERLQKMREARSSAVVTNEEFTLSGEHFKRLYWDEERKMAIFRRTNARTGGLIAYEVVLGKGPRLAYPTANDFGKFGWCYSGRSDEKLKQMIKDKYKIELS